MKRRHLLLLALLILTCPLWAAAPGDEAQAMATANASFEEHSYLPAMQGYREYLQAFPRGAHHEEAECKLCECLIKLRRMADAKKELTDYLAHASDKTWQARACLLMARNLMNFADDGLYRDKQMAAIGWYGKAIPRLAGDDLQQALLDRGRLYQAMGYVGRDNFALAAADFNHVASPDPHGEKRAQA